MQPSRVHFGFHIGQQNTTMAELRDLWRWLDANGADWISLWDHLYEAPPAGGTHAHFEAVAALGALAADTEHARIGCLVFCALYRNVGVLARSAVTLDHIAGGRFELGLGSGWHDIEAHAFGLRFPSQRQRSAALAEQLAALHAWRRGERITTSGDHVVLDDASLVPGPAGRLPIWVGGVGRQVTLRLAGELADGWNAAYVSAAELRELNGVLDDWCEAAGRDAGDVERSVNLMFNLSEHDMATAQEELRRQWGAAADRVRDGALLGRPQDVIDQVAPYIEAGAQLVNVVIRPPWNQDVLEAYLGDVVPAMRAAFT